MVDNIQLKKLAQFTEDLYQRITELVEEYGEALILAPGGSSIDVVAAALEQLPVALQNKVSLSVSDERWADKHEQNFNSYTNIHNRFPGIKMVWPFIATNLKKAERDYSELLANNINWTIPLLGLGSDGHTAGIFPHHLPATKLKFNQTGVVAYEVSSEESPEIRQPVRLTPTFRQILAWQRVWVIIKDDSKQDALARLLRQELPLHVMPAQIFKKLDYTTIYTNIRL